jgi:gluconate kinase
MQCFLFGQIGVGKSTLGATAAQQWRIHFHEGDQDLTPALLEAIRKRQAFTDAMRDDYAGVLAERITQLARTHPRFIIAQGLFYNRQRHVLRRAHPHLRWAWVRTAPSVWSERVQHRAHPLADLSYAYLANPYFEEPDFPHTVITNEATVEDSLTTLRPLLFPDGPDSGIAAH